MSKPRKTQAAPAPAQKPARPSAGGSYIRRPDGSLVQNQPTLKTASKDD